MEGKKAACILNFFFFSRSTLFLSFQLQLQFYMQKRQGSSPSICHPWEPKTEILKCQTDMKKLDLCALWVGL